MRRVKTKKLLVIFLFTLVLTAQDSLYASQWTVDVNGLGDFTSIQAAINAASSGDQITVLPGTYYENVFLDDKNITLTSTAPESPAATIIYGGAGSAVVEFANGDNSVLRGFSITSSFTTRGILCNSSNPIIESCEIFENTAYIGGGMYFGGTSQASVINSTIHNNTAPSGTGGGGGVALRNDADITFFNCLFYENSTGDEGGALNSSDNAHSTWGNCTVTGNNGYWGPGLSSESRLSLAVINSIIAGNSGIGYQIWAGWDEIFYQDVSTKFSDVQGGYPGWPGATQGNIDADPLFVPGPLGNYYLDPLSPCVDAGSDLSSEFFIHGTTQADGVDDSGIVDMGYHYGAVLVPGAASVDIKPGSCPNPLNIKSKGVLPVAVLGTEDFDVTQIDPATVKLEGVAPLRWSEEDVASPFDGELCDCTTEADDGFDDLTLKFDTQEIVAALGDVNDGDELALTLTGELFDGTSFEGGDCVRILKKKAKKK